MKDSLNFLFVFLVSLYASLPAQAQSTCTNQEPSVVSNPDFSVYNNPQLGSRPLSDVCAWENAFGTAWHNSPTNPIPSCAVIQTASTLSSEINSGFYQEVSVTKNSELIIDILIHHISGTSGDSYGHIDNFIVCLTNEDPTTLVQNNQMVEFDKLVLLELNNINISQPQRFTLDQPIVADKNYSKLLVYHSCNANSGSTSINIAKIEVLNTTYSNCYWPQYIGRKSTWPGYKGFTNDICLSRNEKLIFQTEWTNAEQIVLPNEQIINQNNSINGVLSCFSIDGNYNWSAIIKGCWSGVFQIKPFGEAEVSVIGYVAYPGFSINNIPIPELSPGSFFCLNFNNNGAMVSPYILNRAGISVYTNTVIPHDDRLTFIVKNTINNNQIDNIILNQTGFYLVEYNLLTSKYEMRINLNSSFSNTPNYISCNISNPTGDMFATALGDNGNSEVKLINYKTSTIIATGLIPKHIGNIEIRNNNTLLGTSYNESALLAINGSAISLATSHPFLQTAGGFYPYQRNLWGNTVYYSSDENGLELIRHNPENGVEDVLFKTKVLNPGINFAVSNNNQHAIVSYQSMTVANNQYTDSTKIFGLNIPSSDTTCPDRSEVRAMYLYNNEGTSNGFMGNSNETLIANLEMAGVNTVILAVKTNLQNMGTTALAEYLSKIKNFNTLAHQKGWQVHAHPTYSFCDFENYLTEVKPFLLYFKNTFQGSAGISDIEKFDGFHTDFEPFAESCNNGWDNSDGFLFENTYIMPVYYSTIQNIRRELEDCYWPPTSQKGFRLSGTSFWKWPYYSNTMNSPVNALNASISTLTSDNYFDFVMPMNFRGTCQGWFYDWYYSPGYTPSPMDEGPMVMTIQADAQYSSCNNSALNSKTKVLQLQNQMQNLFINKENYLGSCIFDYSRFMAIPQEDQQSNDDVSEDIESISDASPDRTIEEQSTGKPDDLVSVYPNPFIDFIKINNRTGRETTARIYNSTMDLVEESSLLQINTSAYLPGMYFLNIINYKGEIILRTILIKK